MRNAIKTSSNCICQKKSKNSLCTREFLLHVFVLNVYPVEEKEREREGKKAHTVSSSQWNSMQQVSSRLDLSEAGV